LCDLARCSSLQRLKALSGRFVDRLARLLSGPFAAASRITVWNHEGKAT
jgi:hypothetical protein